MLAVASDREPREHVGRNRARWDVEAKDYIAGGERSWAREEPAWGIWRVPESQLGVLPADLADKDAIELGCGTAYVSAWLVRRGARVVGIDTSMAQLSTARRLQRQHGLVNSSLLTLCMPAEDGVAATDRLLRPAFGMFRIEWPGDPGVEFHLSHGDWMRRLRGSGFAIEDLIEVRPPESATTRYPYVTLEWSRQWPAEEIWRARRR